MRHLIDPMDLSVEDIDRLLDRADDIAKNPEKYQEVCKHKKLATLFFEPSTILTLHILHLRQAQTTSSVLSTIHTVCLPS